MTRFRFLIFLCFLAVWQPTATGIGKRSVGSCNSASRLFAAAERHPVSIVEAEIYVQRHRMIMKLKCFADDLELLQGVSPEADGSYDSQELAEATQDHAKFLADRIDIINSAGEKLVAQIVEVLPPLIPEGGEIKQGQLMNLFCGFQFEYTFETPPEFLTIKQRMLGEGYLFPSEFKILMKQAGSDVPYMHMMKPESPETFRFDWNNPVLPSDASESDWKAWFDKQREQTLGITSYSSVYSFIYITNFEVRHEILIPLASLATMIDFERAEPSFLDIAEQDAAREKIKTFFAVDNDVDIDGIKVQPVFDRIDFYGLDLRDFAIQAERRKISMANGRIGVIMSYKAKAPPQAVEVHWNLFNDAIKTVDSIVFAFDKVDKTQFSTFLANNTFSWKSPARPPLPEITNVAIDRLPRRFSLAAILLTIIGCVVFLVGLGRKRVAVIAFGLLIAGTAYLAREVAPWPSEILTAEDASSIFSRLHQNIFRAFDYHDESDVYDALSKSVDGQLLRELYLQIHQRLQMQDQGGAIAKIDQVELLEGQKDREAGSGENLGFEYRCKWNLVGTVEHWGHIHQRTNQYEAQFSVEVRDGAWKITRMQGLDERQVGVKTSLRQF